MGAHRSNLGPKSAERIWRVEVQEHQNGPTPTALLFVFFSMSSGLKGAGLCELAVSGCIKYSIMP